MSDHMTIEDMLMETLAGIDELKTRLRVMELLVPVPQTVTAQNIADIEGVSFNHIIGKAKYLLPRFGVSAFPDGRRRWPLDEYLAWHSKPVQEKIALYDHYLEEIRHQCLKDRGLE